MIMQHCLIKVLYFALVQPKAQQVVMKVQQNNYVASSTKGGLNTNIFNTNIMFYTIRVQVIIAQNIYYLKIEPRCYMCDEDAKY